MKLKTWEIALLVVAAISVLIIAGDAAAQNWTSNPLDLLWWWRR